MMLQGVAIKFGFTPGFTFQEAARCSNRKLYQERGSVYQEIAPYAHASTIRPCFSVSRYWMRIS